MNFAEPYWLLLLLIIPILGVTAWLVSRSRQKRWDVFMAARLKPALLQTTSRLPRWLSLVFLLMAMMLLIVALAKPRGDAGTRTETVKGRNLLFALDLSRSMRVTDVKPDRLSQAKAIIYEMMEAMPNDRIGLVGFAGEPYLFAPLTVDHGAVRETVEQLDETWIPTGGSDVVKGLRLSIETLKKTGVENNALVFISDGEKHDGNLEDIIKEAERAGVYIFTIGVGTEAGDWVPAPEYPNGRMTDEYGNAVRSKMQPEILRAIAEGTHGRFVVAGTAVDIPTLARMAMADLSHFELEGRETRVFTEFYPWFVGPAAGLLILSVLLDTRWRAVARKSAVAATLAATIASSQGATLEEAKTALAGGKMEEAKNAFRYLAERAENREDGARYRLGEAAAEYRATHFREAAEAYSRALLSDSPEVDRAAHLGAGTSLFHLGWQSLGQDATYPDPAPESMATFDELVKAKLAELAEKELPDAGQTETYTLFNSIIVNWTDAVRHYSSTLKLVPGDADAIHNRALTIRYLKRLEELLQEQSDESSKKIPMIAPGEPQEGDGDGDGDLPGEKRGKGDKPGDGSGDDKKKEDGGGDKKDEPKAGETPEEHAKRKLKESEDMQKGPISPGRRETQDPKKDW